MTINLGNLFLNGEDVPFSDSSPKKHAVTNLGVSRNTNIKAHGNASMYFDGNSMLEITNSPDFNLIAGQPITIDFMCYATSYDGYQKFVEAGTGAARWMVNVRSSVLEIRRGATATTSTRMLAVDYSYLIPNQWNHVAVTRDVNNDLIIYVNGINRGSINHTGEELPTDVLKIGGGQSDQNFTGYLDNVRISTEVLWSSDFNSTDTGLLGYPLLVDYASSIYNVSYRGNIRGKAKHGFVRPTLKQFYTSSPNYDSKFKTRVVTPGAETLILTNKLSLTEPGEYTLTGRGTLACKLWGAAGGSAYDNAFGGVGGYTYGEIELIEGTEYKIWVGGGGKRNTVNTIGIEGGFGGGGYCGRSNSTNRWLGSGGGLTGIFSDTVTHANSILIAGGGAGYSGGGNGGGLTGGKGQITNKDTGDGGTQTGGGQAGSFAYDGIRGTDGSELQGGLGAPLITDRYSGGGGGGGYYGGGGGSGNNYQGSSGGGGSSFIHPTLVTNGITMRLNEYGGPVPNAYDEDYTNEAGVAGWVVAGQTEGYGGNGLLVISIV